MTLLTYCHPFLTDISNSQDIHQTPKDLIKDPAQSEELHCSHSSSYNVMLWYKQKRGESLELLAYLVGSSDTVEEKFKNEITLSGSASKNSVLKLERLSPDDSAVYFCAASIHSAVASLPSQQKPFFTTVCKLSITSCKRNTWHEYIYSQYHVPL